MSIFRYGLCPVCHDQGSNYPCPACGPEDDQDDIVDRPDILDDEEDDSSTSNEREPT